MLIHPSRNILELLPRHDVQARLTVGLEGQVVLLEAPAGFAKTETMAEGFRTAHARGRRAVWLGLEGNTDKAALLAGLAAGFGIADRSVSGIFNAITEGPHIVELYLDCVEQIREGATLNWLFDSAPDKLRTVLAGRHLPDLRLSRLRQRGLVIRLGADDLAFTRSETARLLKGQLSPGELEAAVRTLNGWPTLVRLAQLSLKANPSHAARQAVISGYAQVFEEFLIEEVLSALDPLDLRILDAAYGLETFTAQILTELAKPVLEHEVMARFDRLWPLILPEDHKVGWFRLNPVAEAHASRDHSNETASTRRARHTRAARLLAAQGSLEQAVVHASLAGDRQLITETIEDAGGAVLFLRLGFTTLRAILQAVSHDLVIETPSLRLCRAVILAKTARVGEARDALERIKIEVERGDIVRIPVLEEAIVYLDSLFSVYEDQRLGAVDIAALEKQAQAERHESTWKLGWIYNHLTIAYAREDAIEQAQLCARRSLLAYQEERASYPQAFMLMHQAYLHGRTARPDLALEALSRAQGLIQGRHWTDRNLQALAMIPRASALYAQGQLTEVRRMLEQSIPVLCTGETWGDFLGEGYHTLAKAVFVLDGAPKAFAVLEEGIAVADARALPRLRLALSLAMAELQIRSGDLESAELTIAAWPPLEEAAQWPTKRQWREACLIALRLRLRQGGDGAAIIGQLHALQSEVGPRHYPLFDMSALFLKAEAGAVAGLLDLTFTAIEDVAALAMRGRSLQPYQDEGRVFCHTIRGFLRRTGIGRLSATAAEYLALVAPPARRGEGGVLLTEREMQILALLSEGLTSKGIGRQVGLSEATVKFHLKNLYAKLGVARRHLAVAAARNMGLIPSA